MSALIVAMESQILVVDLEKNLATPKLVNTNPESLTLDPFRHGRVYAATFGSGLWVSEDSGETWGQIGKESLPSNTTAIAVSSIEQHHRYGVVYCGSEPSSIYRSDDGGQTWKVPGDIMKLSSSESWSFPPKPDTHHVRFIETDPLKTGLVYTAIEAGALIRSFDGGTSWKDRVGEGPYDTHTLATNSNAPGRVYSAAGDGYYESLDYGETWESIESGLRQHYLYCVSVHPKDPNTVLVSASPGPWTAYNPAGAESYVYRKSDSPSWQRVELVERSTVSVFAPNSDVEGEFFAVNSLGIFRSRDSGASWSRIPVSWAESFHQNAWSATLTS